MNFFSFHCFEIESRPTIPPLSSSDVTTSDASRNRRDAKATTLPATADTNETESSTSTSSNATATVPNEVEDPIAVASTSDTEAAPVTVAATDKDAVPEQPPRESGDGESAALAQTE